MKSATQSRLGLVAAIALMSSLVCIAQIAPATHFAPKSPNTTRQVQANYGQLPLAFEANKGQTDPRVKFVSSGAGYSVFLTSGGMVLSLRPRESVPPVISNSASKTQPTSNNIAGNTPDTTMIFTLVGAASDPKAVGEEPLPTKVNYFIGRDPTKWQTNVQTYAKVRYQNVYPGIDLLYYGNNRQVEYDFIAAPGSDPNKIQFSVTGADSLNVDVAGNLVLTKGTNQLHFQTPAIYQLVNGAQIKVPGNYSLNDSTHVGFTVAPHDNSKTLVIDPVLVYSTFLGGRSYDQGSAIAVDAIGNAYVTGVTSSPDFPLAILGTLNPTQQRMFVVKLDVSGSTLLYADYFGSPSGNDSPDSIAVDSAGSAYVAGQTSSSDFSIVNAYQPTLAGYQNAFLTKFSADGASLVYSTYLGGSGGDSAQAVAIDNVGEATIAGYTSSQNFPMASPYQSSISPDQNGRWGQYSFFSRFSADGSSLIYSSYLAGNLLSQNYCYYCGPYSTINGLALDHSGNLYVVGDTDTTNFPTTSGAFLQTYPGTYLSQVPFIAKFDTSGAVVYSSYFGGTNYSYARAVAVDAAGFAYVTGYDEGGDKFPITATTICDPNTQTCNGMFVTKFDTTGSNLVYSSYLGPNNNTEGLAIQVDAAGDAYVIGNVYSSQFTTVNPIESYAGGQDLLLVEIDPAASTQLFATFVGEDQNESVAGMALDSSGALYVTGSTNSTYFPVTQSAFQSSWGGQNDAFILKIGPATASAVAIGPSLLQFSTLNVGVASPPRSTILRNMGTAPLNIATKIITGDFAETDDCGITVAPGSFCTFTVTFTPTAPGSRFGTIVLGDDASGSPHVINLVGDGSSPIVTLSPQTLTFSSLPVGQTSAVQIITLSNTGNATLNIGSILASGNFAATSNCVSALAFGSSCQIQVTVTPTVGGAVTGILTLTDDAPDSPQTVGLSGSGYVTNGTFIPSIIPFANTAVGATSSPQPVTVTNMGSVAMTVSAVTVTGGFAQTNTCSSIPASGTCTISVTFVPTTSGAQTGTLTINDNAQGNPHAVSLSGTGLAGAAQLSSSGLSFTALAVGTTGSAQTITVTNSGNGTLTVAGIQATGDFAQTNNCASVAPNSGTCTIQVTFTPTSSGTRSGTVTLTDSAVNSPQSVSLTGSGIDFNMSAAGGSDTVKAGATASYTISITPVGGTFSSAVSLICAGAPAFSTCSVDPTSVTPGATPSTVAVTLKTAGTSAQLYAPGVAQRYTFAFWTLTTGFGLFGMFLIGTGRGRTRASILLLLMVLMTGVLFWVGCGSGSSAKPPPTGNSTPPGNYTVLVIGTSGSVKHFTSLTLTVQ
jgi:hypothetical protein